MARRSRPPVRSASTASRCGRRRRAVPHVGAAAGGAVPVHEHRADPPRRRRARRHGHGEERRANGRAATLELRGKTPDGGSVTWRYDLVRVNGEWKLRDETWETR